MTPNNQTISKLIANDDKSEEIISGLKKLILDDNKCISYTYVSLRFGVHVKQAIEILDKFAAEERNSGHTLAVNYVLYGNNDSSENDDEIKMERFMIISESDIDSSTDWFKNGFNKHIYSVGFGEDNNKIELNFDEFDYEVNDKNHLNDLHNLRHLKNPNIEFRCVNRRVAIKPIVHKNEEKNEKLSTDSNDKKESEIKSKPKINTNAKNRAKNAKKNKISNMFSKNKKEIKVENEEKESDDPFGSDSEEETKHKVEDIQSQPLDDTNVSDEEEVKEVKPKPIVKNGNKRQSKNELESSDEEIVSMKKKSKKYKRVRLISESDSENSKEESALHKYISNKKDNSQPIKKLEEVKETHVDEDGYVVTKTVKKEVEETKESDPDLSEDKSEKTERTKQNSKKNTEKKVEKKPSKPSKESKSKSKGQSSITSFFKPKQIST